MLCFFILPNSLRPAAVERMFSSLRVTPRRVTSASASLPLDLPAGPGGWPGKIYDDDPVNVRRAARP